MKKSLPVLIPLFILAAVAGLAFLAVSKLASGNQVAESNVQAVVEGFGKKLQTVSVLAPPDQAAQAIQANYSEYLTPKLLTQWMADPGSAPGKVTSSPWPDRIEITGLTRDSKTKFTVQGKIIEITSNEVAHGGVAATRSIHLIVEQVNTTWLISEVALGSYENP